MRVGQVIDRGVLPCRNCGKPHSCRVVEIKENKDIHRISWAKPGCGSYELPAMNNQAVRDLMAENKNLRRLLKKAAMKLSAIRQ